MDTEEQARKIAAKVAGIREDQVDAAVTAYRSAIRNMYDEPEWLTALFILGHCTCVAEGTSIEMHVAPATKRRPSERLYVYRGKTFETYGEARAEELADQARFSVRVVE